MQLELLCLDLELDHIRELRFQNESIISGVSEISQVKRFRLLNLTLVMDSFANNILMVCD